MTFKQVGDEEKWVRERREECDATSSACDVCQQSLVTMSTLFMGGSQREFKCRMSILDNNCQRVCSSIKAIFNQKTDLGLETHY